jgi:hypothetical protein
MDPVTGFAGTHAYDPPRGIALEAGAYTAYTFNELGTELRSKWRRLSSPTEASALARSKIPGRPGYWFLVGSGPWEGFWIRDTSRIDPVD